MSAPSTEAESSVPLRGLTIAVTRSREQADKLIARLESLGATVYHCAAVAIAPLEDFAELDAVLARLEAYDWVIFTSCAFSLMAMLVGVLFAMRAQELP